jgi:N6-adenosine-specific RNA methylase IME4
MIKIDPEIRKVLPPTLRAEIDENACRKELTPSEWVMTLEQAEEIAKRQAKEREIIGKSIPVETFPHGSKGKSRDKIGAIVGVSGRTYEKAKAVVEAAKAEPERFGHLIAEMDRTGKVNAAHRALRRAEDEKRILALAPVAGLFKTLVIDPPWQYDMDFLGRGKPDYDTMSHEELLALPVESWAEADAHCYLWTTNAMFPAAVELMSKWGFRHNTVLTWAKPHYGLGTHFRGQTEHVLFGIRGTLATRANDISTLFEAPVGKHSEKPEKFYEIVRRASYPPYGEAFQRMARSDFVNLYQQQIALEAAQ